MYIGTVSRLYAAEVPIYTLLSSIASIIFFVKRNLFNENRNQSKSINQGDRLKLNVKIEINVEINLQLIKINGQTISKV